MMLIFFYSFWFWAAAVILSRSFLWAFGPNPIPESLFYFSGTAAVLSGLAGQKSGPPRRGKTAGLVAVIVLLFCAGLLPPCAVTGALDVPLPDGAAQRPILPLTAAALGLFLSNRLVSSLARGRVLALLRERPEALLFLSAGGAAAGAFYSVFLFLPLGGLLPGAVMVCAGLAALVFFAVSIPGTGDAGALPLERTDRSGVLEALLSFFLGLAFGLAKKHLDRASPFFLGSHLYVREYSLILLGLFAAAALPAIARLMKKRAFSPALLAWSFFSINLALWCSGSLLKTFAELTPALDARILATGRGSLFFLKAFEVFFVFAPPAAAAAAAAFLFLKQSNPPDARPSSLSGFLAGVCASILLFSGLLFPDMPERFLLPLSVLCVALSLGLLLFRQGRAYPGLRRVFMMIFSFFLVAFSLTCGLTPLHGKNERVISRYQTGAFTFTFTEDTLEHLCVWRNECPSLLDGNLLFEMERHAGDFAAAALRPPPERILIVQPQTKSLLSLAPSLPRNATVMFGPVWATLRGTRGRFDLAHIFFPYPVTPYERIYLAPAFLASLSRTLTEGGVLHIATIPGQLPAALAQAKAVFPFVRAFSVSSQLAHVLCSSRPLEPRKEYFHAQIMAGGTLFPAADLMDIGGFEDIALMLGNGPEEPAPGPLPEKLNLYAPFGL